MYMIVYNYTCTMMIIVNVVLILNVVFDTRCVCCYNNIHHSRDVYTNWVKYWETASYTLLHMRSSSTFISTIKWRSALANQTALNSQTGKKTPSLCWRRSETTRQLAGDARGHAHEGHTSSSPSRLWLSLLRTYSRSPASTTWRTKSESVYCLERYKRELEMEYTH